MIENKKSRVDFVFEQFSKQYEKSVKKDKLFSIENIQSGIGLLDDFLDVTAISGKLFTDPIIDNYIDISFLKFISGVSIELNTLGATFKEAIFNYFLKFDPSPNKEYIQWFVNLYGDLCKDRPQINTLNRTNERFSVSTINNEVLFFEDFGKISEALETFIFLKKTNVLSAAQRDINQYKTYKDFVNTIKPYAPTDNDDSETVHTLTHSEVKCIQNFIDFVGIKSDAAFQATSTPIAELIYEDSDWVIVQTHNKQANAIFGKNTTWCTAGTRYMDMFTSYHVQGPLIVLIKKGFGSAYQIRKNANVRLQFHFESGQYMDAKDAGIKIDVFLKKYPNVKAFLKKYVEAVVLKMTMGNQGNQIINFLKNLGYADELVRILKKIKPEELELNNFEINSETLSEIGELVSLKRLILDDCWVSSIPSSFAKLTNLKVLDLTNNKDLTEIPEYVNQLTSLAELNFSNCNIKNKFNISNLKNLEQLRLDKNARLTELPILKDNKKLVRIQASNCDIRELTDDIMNLQFLYMLDMHGNINLKSVPREVTALPELVACNFDKTKLSKELLNFLVEQGENKPQQCAVAAF